MDRNFYPLLPAKISKLRILLFQKKYQMLMYPATQFKTLANSNGRDV